MKVAFDGAGNIELAMIGYIAVYNKVNIKLFTGRNILEKGVSE